jgi:hypothetical protein
VPLETAPSELQLLERASQDIEPWAVSPSVISGKATATNDEGFQSEILSPPDAKELSDAETPPLSPRRETESPKLQVPSADAWKQRVEAALQLPEDLPQFERLSRTGYSAAAKNRLQFDLEATLKSGDCVFSELCGVFFVVNLLRALGMPQSLEQECNCELGLGSWECLELIARCLLNASRPDLAYDPVWRLLSILDGRSPEKEPGEAFRPASFYRLPKAWLGNEEVSTAAIRVRRNRFEVWNLLGFPMTTSWSDGPLTARNIKDWSEGYALGSLRRFPRTWSGAHALGISPARSLQSFLAFLMPFVQWRLAASLGLKSKPKPDFTKLLLSRTGKVWVTRTHIDVVMPLKLATSEVRFAGLDVDPGWVPNIGRIIKFHFQ